MSQAIKIYNLALELARQGQSEEALQGYKRALKLINQGA